MSVLPASIVASNKSHRKKSVNLEPFLHPRLKIFVFSKSYLRLRQSLIK